MLHKLKFGTHIFFMAFCLIMFLWVLFSFPRRAPRLSKRWTRCLVITCSVDRKRMHEIMAQVRMKLTAAQLKDEVHNAKDTDKQYVEKAVKGGI